MSNTVTQRSRATVLPGWLVTTLAVVFALPFAYIVWQAISRLVIIVQLAGESGVSLSGIGWVVLLLAIIIPIVAFLIAAWTGRRQGVLGVVLLFLTAFAVTAALTLGMTAIFSDLSLIAT